MKFTEEQEKKLTVATSPWLHVPRLVGMRALNAVEFAMVHKGQPIVDIRVLDANALRDVPKDVRPLAIRTPAYKLAVACVTDSRRMAAKAGNL